MTQEQIEGELKAQADINDNVAEQLRIQTAMIKALEAKLKEREEV